ncbi:RCC1 and BTB domain-containing protein 1-like [Watersipora subatra]|uniref:RCC1 and BTB domain-containing protein 1-like n=1 Tax=Watersipora subatra TaxID=2589382 RepID=UPI00355BB8C5
MTLTCLYGGLPADALYTVDLSECERASQGLLQDLHSIDTDTSTSSPDQVLIQKVKEGDITSGDICFIGDRLLLQKNKSKEESGKWTAIYYKEHVCLVCIGGQSGCTIQHRCLHPNCQSKHETVQSVSAIMGLSATDALLIFHTEDGSLWSLSSIGNSPEKVLFSNRKVRQVACGKEHIALVTNLGQVYTFGGGSRGQLGHGSLDSLKDPKLVDALSGIYATGVRAGGWHSIVISDIGDLYSWGWNESGQVGLPCLKDKHGLNRSSAYEGRSIVPYPSLLFEKDDSITLTDVSCGSRHSAALTDDGKLYTWGWNGYGQLLTDSNMTLQDSPGLVHEDKCFKHVICAGWCTLAYVSQPLPNADDSKEAVDDSCKHKLPTDHLLAMQSDRI